MARVRWWHALHPVVRRRLWRWARLGGGALILAALIIRLGAGPFIDGVRRVDAGSLAAAGCITAVTTIVSAWRWRLIADGLGLRIPLGSAVASYYRSQFLNSTLPGGVVGDVHRGVRHGVEIDDVSLGLRSVLWDRAAGQLVQVTMAVVVLAVASGVRPTLPAIAGLGLTGLAVIAVIAVLAVIGAVAVTTMVSPLLRHRRLPPWWARLTRTVRSDVLGMLTMRAAPAILLASALVVLGHVGVFLVAARAAGLDVPAYRLVPLAMLVLLAMTVPISIAGWGPREGVAAWAFAVAGLGAARGVETATVYGILGLAATLPGAVVLLLSRRPQVSTTNEKPLPVGIGAE